MCKVGQFRAAGLAITRFPGRYGWVPCSSWDAVDVPTLGLTPPSRPRIQLGRGHHSYTSNTRAPATRAPAAAVTRFWRGRKKLNLATTGERFFCTKAGSADPPTSLETNYRAVALERVGSGPHQ